MKELTGSDSEKISIVVFGCIDQQHSKISVNEPLMSPCMYANYAFAFSYNRIAPTFSLLVAPSL